MLHLLLADGSTRLVPEAITARIDEDNSQLICVNGSGREVARFARESVTVFSDRAFPSSSLTEKRRHSFAGEDHPKRGGREMTGDAQTAREEELVRILTARFPGRLLEARIISVHKLEGGEVSTLRFTVDEASSTDLDREQIASWEGSEEQLADEVARELQEQLGRQ